MCGRHAALGLVQRASMPGRHGRSVRRWRIPAAAQGKREDRSGAQGGGVLCHAVASIYEAWRSSAAGGDAFRRSSGAAGDAGRSDAPRGRRKTTPLVCGSDASATRGGKGEEAGRCGGSGRPKWEGGKGKREGEGEMGRLGWVLAQAEESPFLFF